MSDGCSEDANMDEQMEGAEGGCAVVVNVEKFTDCCKTR